MKWNLKPHYHVQAPARARVVELLFRTLPPHLFQNEWYTDPINVPSPIDLRAPFRNFDPVSIAATSHPLLQNVPLVPTNLHRIDMLGVDVLHPTLTQFPETTTETNFPHNSIQHASPHMPLSPLFSANPPNTFS